jgi:hypothetical protein
VAAAFEVLSDVAAYDAAALQRGGGMEAFIEQNWIPLDVWRALPNADAR